MSMAVQLPHDVYEPPAPPWWPPAPGWWLLAALALLAVAGLVWWWHRRRRLRARLRQRECLFDETLVRAETATARIAAISELLRRAARLRDPQADRLSGEDWLHFLDDGDADHPFSEGPGRALLDAAYRRDSRGVHMQALERVARARYLAWMREAR